MVIVICNYMIVMGYKYIYNNNNEDMINYSDNNTMITITIKMSTYNIW